MRHEPRLCPFVVLAVSLALVTMTGHRSDEAVRPTLALRVHAPLWNPNSRVIYWWTADEVGTDRAYRVSYNGGVHLSVTTTRRGYLSRTRTSASAVATRARYSSASSAATTWPATWGRSPSVSVMDG